jgi:hypothetical protein
MPRVGHNDAMTPHEFAHTPRLEIGDVAMLGPPRAGTPGFAAQMAAVLGIHYGRLVRVCARGTPWQLRGGLRLQCVFIEGVTGPLALDAEHWITIAPETCLTALMTVGADARRVWPQTGRQDGAAYRASLVPARAPRVSK